MSTNAQLRGAHMFTLMVVFRCIRLRALNGIDGGFTLGLATRCPLNTRFNGVAGVYVRPGGPCALAIPASVLDTVRVMISASQFVSTITCIPSFLGFAPQCCGCFPRLCAQCG